jgi:hypothetical protein
MIHYLSRCNQICGLYYNFDCNGRLQKTYLPQVALDAHAAILGTTSRTVLKQTFANPSTTKGIREVCYTFPLYEGVSVVGFTCQVGDRTIVGEVKEKEKARAVFNEAVAKGQAAGLLEQLPDASDVFTTTVGNIPPGAKVVIIITYLGELKHDMEVDGIRFTIPNIICPRYGDYPGEMRATSAIQGNGISITVDAEMADGSFIQKMQSPTHPIAMTMGTTSLAPNADPAMTKASATLTLGTAELDKDFVLQIIAKNTGIPQAILETHPTLPNHRALMATLVPKFALPAEKPELVFVCDRSGSMGGSRITLVIQALKVFLKSLPVGVKFNICSFGSHYSFLWEKSVTYSQKTLEEAIRHVESFQANYNGTEMLAPLKATIDQRYKDMPLNVMLLTDGQIWEQDILFAYLNESVIESKAPIRLFTLGIGNGVSHALIEGIAKAGNGFSQSVGEGEKMDKKVVRMLKGALSPHVNDYTLEVKYSSPELDEGDDEFEIVEKVTDSLNVKLNIGTENKKRAEMVSHPTLPFCSSSTNYHQKKLFLLFDPSADPDMDDPITYDESGQERYAHLPHIAAPNIIQAPQAIPSLYAFHRTTVYLLLGPDAANGTPKSVILRGTSVHGPLELEIPINALEQPGETIHQLAAKKAIAELEAGRGWLSEAKEDSGQHLKKSFEGRYSDMVEREAVRLGVMFKVGGKWCSFVAVESSEQPTQEKEQDWEWLEDENENPFANAHSESDTLPTTSSTSKALGVRSRFFSSGNSDSDSTHESDSETQQEESDDDDEPPGRFFQASDKKSELACIRNDLETEVYAANGVTHDSQLPRPAFADRIADGNDHNPVVNELTQTNTNDADFVAQQRAALAQSQANAAFHFGENNPMGGLFGNARPGSNMSQFGKPLLGGAPIQQVQGQPAQSHQPIMCGAAPATRSGFPGFGHHGNTQNSRGLASRPLFPHGIVGVVNAQSQQHVPTNSPANLFAARPDHSQVFSASGSAQAMLFGQPSASFGGQLGNTSVQSGSGLFGQVSASSATPFGHSSASSGGQYGQAPARSGASSFGAPSTSSGNPFGQVSAQSSSSLFGQPSAHSGSSLFGERPAPCGSLFGGPKPQPEEKQALALDAYASYADSGSSILDFGGPSASGFIHASASHPPNGNDDAQVLHNYQGQLLTLNQDNKNRLVMRRRSQDKKVESPWLSPDNDSSSQSSSGGVSGPLPKSGLFGATTGSGLYGGGIPAPFKPEFLGTLASDAPPSSEAPAAPERPAPETPEELLFYLIFLQTYEGAWEPEPDLLSALRIKRSTLEFECAKLGLSEKVFVTELVIVYFEEKLSEDEESWELVAEKAKAWLSEQKIPNIGDLIKSVAALVK